MINTFRDREHIDSRTLFRMTATTRTDATSHCSEANIYRIIEINYEIHCLLGNVTEGLFS